MVNVVNINVNMKNSVKNVKFRKFLIKVPTISSFGFQKYILL